MKYFCVIAMAAMALVAPAQVGHYKPYRVSSDFHEVANRKALAKILTLTPAHRALLQKNLFVVAPRGDEQLYWVYGQNDYQNFPSLVTTDAVLHLYHVFYDATLRQIEQTALTVKLKRLTERMLAASRQAVANPNARAAAEKSAAYFAVADALLDGEKTSPNAAVDTELSRIYAASGVAVSEIFPAKIDYTRFIVRGHYTKSETLKRYFRAMTWYGMMPFQLADENGTPQPSQIQFALFVAQTLRTSGGEADWEAIYEPTSLYVGTSNMITPQEVRQAAIDASVSSLSMVPSKAGEIVRLLRKPRIQAHVGTDTDTKAVQFRFMGLRYIPDSEILQRLTGESRPMPSGLDVMSVLGSGDATRILDGSPARYNPKHWANYRTERAKLTTEFAQTPASTWSSNLYWGWIDTVRLLLKPIPSGYPQFMRNEAWQDKNLSTALAFWTELRHDTILYGEQSVAEMGGDDEVPPFVKGFVEPNVAVYERLIRLSEQSRQELQKRGLLDKDGVHSFQSYEKLLDFLLSVSKKELAGTRLTKDEYLRIRHIDGDLGDLTVTMLEYGNNFKSLTEDDMNMALVADVHTAGSDALEEGVGKADTILAIVPIEGKLYFARGTTFSYYEFAVPTSQRMTDEAWKASLADGKDHARPHWTSSFLVPVKLKEKE
ncbi:MAG TPA: DUF3160 domain-containing protein [Fimbriimonadaceae bacterium]|nr:DUF3160 domain-containing protein [Fimbriimonadaceae bacterium]